MIQKNCHNGFTLVDMLIALVLLTIGLLGLAKLTVAIMFGNQVCNKVTMATIVAQSKVEDMRRLGYKGIVGTDMTTIEGFNTIKNYPDFQRITQTDVDAPVDGLKTITVTVNWKIRERPKSMVISTIFTK